MKRRILSSLLVGVMLFNLAGCQTTPEEAVVVDKSKGLPEGSVIPVESETPKDLQIPEYWQETMDRSEGYVTVVADCQIEIQEVYNTPVYSYEMKHITNEMLKKLCDYFAEGDKLYEEPAMTKAELEEEKEKMLSRSGVWGTYSVTNMVKRMEELIEKAPDERTYKYIDAEFTVPYQTELEYVNEVRGTAYYMVSDYYFDTDEKIGFKVRVDKGREDNPLIYAIDYNESQGSTSNFLFSQGTFVTEDNLESSLYSFESLDLGEGDYGNYLYRLKEEMEQTEDEAFTEENALMAVDKVMEDLSLENFAVIDCNKAIGNPEYESWAGLDEEDVELIAGYKITLSYKAGDLEGYEQPFQRPYSDLPETVYAPAFSTEQIDIIVTKDGVQRFEWTNISEKKDEIAENTKLLTFGEIKEKLADHLLYITIAGLGEESKTLGDTAKYTVKNVQLRAANVPAFEAPLASWLVPVWIFEMEHEVTFSTSSVIKMPDTIVVLNAIDGGYVKPRIDSRIPIPGQ